MLADTGTRGQPEWGRLTLIWQLCWVPMVIRPFFISECRSIDRLMLALLSLSSERLPVRSFRHFEMSSCHFCLCRFRCFLRALLECHRFLCSADCAASIEMFPVIFLLVEPPLDRSPIDCRRTNALVLLHRAFRFAFPLHDQPDELRATRVRNTYPITRTFTRACAQAIS